jgi:hypothetical protein
MTTLTHALTLFTLLTGFTSRYDIGVFPATVDARLQMGHITQDQVNNHDGFAATVDCDLIGTTLYVMPNGGLHMETAEVVNNGDWQRVLVADCAVRSGHDGARDWMLDNNILLELDGLLAAEYGYTHYGLMPVVVSLNEPIITR